MGAHHSSEAKLPHDAKLLDEYRRVTAAQVKESVSIWADVLKRKPALELDDFDEVSTSQPATTITITSTLHHCDTTTTH